MDSQKSPDTIAVWTTFPVSINASPHIFFCFTLKHTNDVSFFWILKLFTLYWNSLTWFIRLLFPGFTFLLKTTLILIWKRIVPPLSPLLQNPPASSYSPSSSTRISSWQFPWIPKIFVPFSSYLVAGSLCNNVHTHCICSNKCPSSVLFFCTSSWVVLCCYLCNNYPLQWLCPQPYPLVRGVSFSIL